MTNPVFTIGHSTHSQAVLIKLLRTHGVNAVADVRSTPYSRMNPQFNREPLKEALSSAGIKYVFLGKELGARSEDPCHYVAGKVQYERLAQSTIFREGLSRVISGASRYRIALLCAEKDPLDCHRTILVSRELVRKQVAVAHILADGILETHSAAVRRLLNRFGMRTSELFRSNDELVDEAYARQSDAIAYTIPNSNDAARTVGGANGRR
ncbi:DUF488 family protein [Sorangium cellulosum]|uniref:DUF488 domain-containing protein n=1 Tax=Sorangium cellulosum TaxID=56 RepID=UPI0006777AF6|nr:DUF488 domain-containing protein [Sorangium cellulosum]